MKVGTGKGIEGLGGVKGGGGVKRVKVGTGKDLEGVLGIGIRERVRLETGELVLVGFFDIQEETEKSSSRKLN